MQKQTEHVLTNTRNAIANLEMCSCFSWLKTGASGMTVQEIGVPTGFEADLDSITKLPTLKKVETENRKVILYLDEVSTKILVTWCYRILICRGCHSLVNCISKDFHCTNLYYFGNVPNGIGGQNATCSHTYLRLL